MLRKLYDHVIALSATRWALPVLAAVSFAESSFFPLPPDVVLAPMVLARPQRAWTYALVCSLASVLGGLLGYAIGLWLTPLGLAILRVFGHSEGLAVYRDWFAHNGFVLILIKGLTPIPFKLVTIAAGLARFDLRQFVLAAAITRGGRFFIEAALLQRPAVKAVVERHLVILAGAAIALLAVAVITLKYLHIG